MWVGEIPRWLRVCAAFVKGHGPRTHGAQICMQTDTPQHKAKLFKYPDAIPLPNAWLENTSSDLSAAFSFLHSVLISTAYKLKDIPFNIFINLYIWLFCLHVCLCTIFVPGAAQKARRERDPQEPELQTGVNCHVGAGS